MINNIDSIIIAQSPKMAPHIQNMRENIAKALNTNIDNISVKATTEEGLGFTGTKEGISAQSICLLNKKIKMLNKDKILIIGYNIISIINLINKLKIFIIS